MCNICKCVSWGIDIIQRVLTFALACWLCCAICVGVIMASVAGIAYGYNYMLAEYVTLTKSSNVSVYVRRGQFYEKPDLGFRRSGVDGVESEEFFSSNSSDYQDMKVQNDTGSLSAAWKNAMGSRKFAQKLTKYSHTGGKQGGNTNIPGNMVESPTRNKFTTVVYMTRVFSVPPKPAMQTHITPGRTDMRNYDSIQKQTLDSERDFYPLETEQPNIEATPKFESYATSKPKHKEKKPDIKIKLKDLPRSKIIPALWRDTKSSFSDYPAEEMDEDNVVYKPV